MPGVRRRLLARHGQVHVPVTEPLKGKWDDPGITRSENEQTRAMNALGLDEAQISVLVKWHREECDRWALYAKYEKDPVRVENYLTISRWFTIRAKALNRIGMAAAAAQDAYEMEDADVSPGPATG